MKVVYGLTNFKPLDKRPVVALGVFDGVHRGHQRIIGNLLKESKKLKTSSLIVTFFPHPQKESNLYSLDHRLKIFEEAGVDLCLVIRFTSAFRRISALNFLEKIIIKKINPIVVIIGKNFTFGKSAKGNWRILRDYSKKAGYRLKAINVLIYKGISVSSSYIRNLIRSGKLKRARQLLGRPVSIFGRVFTGTGFGRTLGCPTANINPEQEVFPPSGVYVIRAKVRNKFFKGICYIGRKPTLNKRRSKTVVEVHLFNFRSNLYGSLIQIDFVKKIRNEKKFSSIRALARQIKRDIINCHNQFRL